MARGRRTYELDDAAFPAEAYRLGGTHNGIAWYVLGWETQADEDTEWTGIEERTGSVVVVMVGDDRHEVCEVSDLTPLDDLDYCAQCGQIGCSHDGRDRTERTS